VTMQVALSMVKIPQSKSFGCLGGVTTIALMEIPGRSGNALVHRNCIHDRSSSLILASSTDFGPVFVDFAVLRLSLNWADALAHCLSCFASTFRLRAILRSASPLALLSFTIARKESFSWFVKVFRGMATMQL